MDESITIKIEQLEELLENKEYAKEWKADRYFGLIKENMRLEQENEKLREQQEYWDKEYVKLDKKTEEYRNKYLKWKRKTKGLRSQGKQTRKVKGVENYSNIFEDFQRKLIRESKCIECNKYGHCAQECEETKRKCYTCGRIGHKQKDCHKDHICKKCNRKGHAERVCGNRKLKRKEE